MLEAVELRVAGEPIRPAGKERFALTFSDEDAVQVATGNTQLLGGERCSGEPDQAAFRLVGS